MNDKQTTAANTLIILPSYSVCLQCNQPCQIRLQLDPKTVLPWEGWISKCCGAGWYVVAKED